MAISKSQAAAVAKYQKKTYDKIILRLKKGEREKWKEAASSQGLSFNQFVVKAVTAEMERLGADAGQLPGADSPD